MLWVRANPRPLRHINMGGPQEQKWPRICSNSKHEGERLVFIPYKPSLTNQTTCSCFQTLSPVELARYNKYCNSFFLWHKLRICQFSQTDRRASEIFPVLVATFLQSAILAQWQRSIGLWCCRGYATAVADEEVVQGSAKKVDPKVAWMVQASSGRSGKW